MIRLYYLMYLLVSISIAGCGSSPMWSPPRPLHDDISVVMPTSAQPDEILENPSGDLTLRHTLSLVMRQNSHLKAAAWDVHIAATQQRGAALLPNPELEIEYENFDEPETSISLSQIVDLGFKRFPITKAARYGSEMAAWSFEAERIALLTEATQAFIDVLTAQEHLALAQEMTQIADRVHAMTMGRVQAGHVSPIEESRADVERSLVQLDLEQARTDLTASRNYLASLWGSLSAEFDKVSGDLNKITEPPSMETVMARLPQNPELIRWIADIQQRKTMLTLEKLARLPEITLTGGMKRADELEDDVFFVGVGLEIPLFNRNQAAIQEAGYHVRQGEFERQSAETALKMALINGCNQLQQTYDASQAFRTRIILSAENSFEAIDEGYQAGEFSLLDLLDAEQTLADVRTKYLDTLTDYHYALIKVEQLIGQKLFVIKTEEKTEEN